MVERDPRKSRLAKIVRKVASHVDALESNNDTLRSSLLALRIAIDYPLTEDENYTFTLPKGTTREDAQKAVDFLRKLGGDLRNKLGLRNTGGLEEYHVEGLEGVPKYLIAKDMNIREEGGRVQVYASDLFYPDSGEYNTHHFAREIQKHLIDIAFAAQSKESQHAATV